MNKPLAEVREDDVIKLFRSMPFGKSLRQAAGFTKRTGYESGFLVARDLYSGSRYVSSMCKGTTENFQSEHINHDGFFDFDFGDQNVSFERCYRFLDLHFHPDITGYPKPSCLDLQLAQEDCDRRSGCEDVDARPIIAVAHVLEDDQIVTLLYQKSIEADIEQMQDFKELDFDLSAIDSIDPGYVVDCLEGSGLFYADILTLEKKCVYRPNDNDYNKLKRFVHTPHRQSLIDNTLHQPAYTDL